MSLNEIKLSSSNYTNTSPKYSFFNFVQKPIEIYVFINPLCPECWSLEPYLKKLSIEYGHFFTIRPIISGHFSTLNCEKTNKPVSFQENTTHQLDIHEDALSNQNPALFPWVALAIKAAEFQGKNAGKTFLRIIQQNFFLNKRNISDKDILTNCAREANLDVQEFKKDLYSELAKKAIQRDLKLKKEMDVDYTPTIVFFNQTTEEHGIKISGLNSYHTYVHILSEVLQKKPNPAKKPPLENFLAFYRVVGNKEVSVVYDWSLAETNKMMKKLQLKQKAKQITIKSDILWQYLK